MGEKKVAKKRKNEEADDGKNQAEDASEDNTEDEDAEDNEKEDCLPISGFRAVEGRRSKKVNTSSLLFLHLPYPLHRYQVVDRYCQVLFRAA